ncbi:MAG: hypothetical protein IKH57_21250 [Clostridia bacterium]|nr:hypothetical protein [Clostridia bacterium]
MLYPTLNEISKTRLWTEQFVGLDRRPRTYDGAFSAMGNMSGDPWPLISSRKRRGLVEELNQPLGLCALGKLAWIDGSTLYYDGTATPITSLSTDSGMLPKKMVVMGAYIVIWPDAVYYNTVKPTDYGSINRLYATASGASITLTLSDMDGVDYPAGSVTVSDTEPQDPSQGDYWIDTSATPHQMKQYSEMYESWIGVSSVYVKIAATGIGAKLTVQDGVKISGLAYSGNNTALKKQIEDLNATHIVQAVDTNYIVVVGLIDENYTQTTGTVRADRKAPEMDYVIECNNRLWGCRYGLQDGEFVNVLYASALGDFKNWFKYGGTSMDSYAVNIGSDGPFTAAVTHRGCPYFFKAECLHRILGEKPSNFQTQVTICKGVAPGAWRTVVPYNGALYYLADTGPQMFDSLPQDIGAALGPGKLTGGAACVSDGKYYLSTQDEGGQWSLYVFDTERLNWHRQDDAHALAFAALNGETYMLLENGLLWALNGMAGTEEAGDLTWYAETAPMGYEHPDHKYISRFLLRMKLGADAECHILIQYDSDGIWNYKGTMHGNGKVDTYLVPIVPRRCGHASIRIQGTGDIQLYGVAREMALGRE